MMVVTYLDLVVKKEMLLNVPQAQIGSIAPLNCFKHSNECLALHTRKINLTNKWNLVELQLETSSSQY